MLKQMIRRLIWATVLLSLAAFAAGFIGFMRATREFESMALQRFAVTDGVVVFTGGQDRVSEGINVLASGRAKRLLISGMNPNTSSADLAHELAKFRNFSECCIDLGYEAQNTIGNAEETRNWMRAHHFVSLTVVTSSYHMLRALAELQHALPGTELVPHVVMDAARGRGEPVSADNLRLYFVEYVKYLVAHLRFMLVPAEGLSSNGASRAVFLAPGTGADGALPHGVFCRRDFA